MKDDKLIEKAELILTKIDFEKNQNSEDQSIGYFEGKADNNIIRKWILRREKVAEHRIVRDINGCAINADIQNINNVYRASETIYRDSPMGRFISKGVGEYPYKRIDGKEIKMLIDLLSVYSTTEDGDVVNGSINFIDNKQEFRFTSLIKELALLKNIESDISIKEKELEILNKDNEEARKLRNILEQKNAEKSELKKKIEQYISQEVALRDQPILDKYQEDVKRSKILKGTLIINGGPGTGKTTALIQRINYLTAPTLQDEVGDFNKEQKSILFDQQRSWVFYSPSELLRGYLSNAMVAEGLEADQKRVLTWDSHRKILLRETGLINPDKQKPFVSKKSKDSFFIQTSKVYKELNELFMRYILDKQSSKIEKIHDDAIFSKLSKSLEYSVADSYRIELMKFAISMRDSSLSALRYRKLDTWVPFFISFQEEFLNRFKDLNSKLLDEIRAESSLLQVKIKRDLDVYNWLLGVIEEEKANNQQDDEFEDEDEDEFEDEDLGNENLQKKVNRKLTNLVRIISLYYIDSSNTKISQKNKILFEKTEKYLNRDKLVSLGIRLYFKKYFEKPTKGLEANLFSEIPTSYKVFRRTILHNEASCLTSTGISMCAKTLKNGNIYLYKEEADYLLAIIFNLCKAIYKNRKIYFNNSNHKYVVTFRQYMKGVVAVDEATDFSLWELVAMSSLSHPLFNSVTLSGDLMQRLTNKGLTSWSEYINVVSDTEVRDLKIAYRQTAKLLNVASEIYSWNVSSPAEFISHYKTTPIDPDPLVFISDDSEEKIDWLVNRIMDIQKVYENRFPTVAIFVRNDSEVIRIANLLGDSEEFEESGIEVKACVQGQILGNKQDVRIFSVEYIKGLEFGAVFFLDLDSLSGKKDELINKYIYVGLSRANFFLGVTLSEKFSGCLEYLEPLFQEGNWNELGTGSVCSN